MPQEHHAFTIRYSGLTREIFTEALIAVPRIFPDLDHEPTNILAIWDTGATSSSITQKMVEKLNLPPISQVKVQGVHDEKTVNVYIIDIYLPNKVIIPQVRVSEASGLGPGNYDLLIGMDIISLGDFAITNCNQKTTMSFRIPSHKEIDFVPESDEYNLRLNPTMNRKKRRQMQKKLKKKKGR